jgi:large subunit ribosomal protein L17
VLTGFRKGDGGEKAFIELLGSEKIIDAKREKRAEARSKRAEETRKMMEEQQQAAPVEGGEEQK